MKLAIISHTEHYKRADSTIVGWGPTVSELNHLAQDFDEIYHLAFLHPGSPPPSSLPYTSSKVKFVAMNPVGGKGIGEKLKILWNIPSILSKVNKTLNKVDAFQLRTPTGMGVFLIPYLTIFSKKKGWYKYAGNWNQENPPLGYGLQRWMLKNQKRKVTINGRWPNQPKHCLTFENPCLTLEERKEGHQIANSKIFQAPFTFCFVGRLEDAKGVQRIIDAFGAMKLSGNVAAIHFIGNGEKMDFYKKQSKEFQIPAVFHGFLERSQVFDIFRKSHFILLPSDSEGFPKVIAEAMNFGCIPLVSDISSIGQYVNAKNGFLLNPINQFRLKKLINEALEETEEELKKRASDCYLVGSKFTFEFYRNKIQQNIIVS